MNPAMRSIYLVLAFSLVAIACGAQTAPEREPFSPPSVIVPDSLVGTDPGDIYPESGECTIGRGTGVRVLLVEDDSPADGALRAGDIVTSVDAVPVGSYEQLRAILRGSESGDVLVFAGTRATSGFSAEVEISVPNDGAAEIGIIAETRIDAVAPDQVDASGRVVPLTRPVILDGNMFLHEPARGTWSAYEGIPAPTMAGFGESLYSIANTDPLSLVKLGASDVIPIDAQPFTIRADEAALTLTPTAFRVMLGSVGETLVIGGEAGDGAGIFIPTVYGVDPVARVFSWSSPLPPSPSGNLRIPSSGYRSPDGSRVAIGVIEQDRSTGALSEIVAFFIYDVSGNVGVVPGFNGLPPSAVVTGWYDDDSLAYVVPIETPQFASWNTRDGEHTSLFTLTTDDAAELLHIEPVGDGRYAVLVYETETTLIDVPEFQIARVTTRGCSYVPVGGLSGSPGQ